MPLHEARNEHTDLERLSQLAESDDIEVRVAVATNPSTPWDVLGFLSYDRKPVVLASVVAHRNVDVKTLDRLSSNPHPIVQAALHARHQER